MEQIRDLTTTRFVLPPDAKLLPVAELAPRLRAKLGPVDGEQVVVTRPGYRVTTRLITPPLAALLDQFRRASLITDAVVRFSKSCNQDAFDILDLSFDALATFIEGRTLVAADSPEARAAEPSLAAGQAVDGMEVEHLVRSLDDTEVYRVRLENGDFAALKIARDMRAKAILVCEAKILDQLGGADSPALLQAGIFENRQWLAMEWCDGVSIAVAAQQARASGDRAQLHQLAVKLLDAYSRLHERGIVHGDIHTGNILVDDTGRILLLDFGRARTVGNGVANDPNRAGIAHYYDPQIAAALLAGILSPAASYASEQFSLATLVYLLLTGLHPIDPAAEQTELLQRIVNRPMLPFAARGVDSWPLVETVLRRALAKNEHERFPSTAAFALALRKAGGRCRPSRRDTPKLECILSILKAGDLSPLKNLKPHILAWLSLRGALALEDAELLAIADLWAGRSDQSFEARRIAAEVARARSDRRAESAAIDEYFMAAGKVRHPSEQCRALLYAAHIGIGVEAREKGLEKHLQWAGQRIDELGESMATDEAWLQALLALSKAGAVSLPSELNSRLNLLAGGSVWLWALAYEVFQLPEYLERAVSAELPSVPFFRGMACLRLHQLTGEMRWVSAARKVSRHSNRTSLDIWTELLSIELEMPARAVAPPFQIVNS
jgi:tRNA A-37 threonylcarbamoyl transferase component Bud32